MRATPLFAHGAAAATGGVAPDHVGGLIAPLFLPIAIWLFLRLMRWQAGRGAMRARAWIDGYDASSLQTKVAALLLLIIAAVHAGLVPGHAQDDPGTAQLFAVDAALLTFTSILAFTRRRWRIVAATLLVGNVLAYLAYVSAGREDVDEVGIACKLLELLALALVLLPEGLPLRSLASTTRWLTGAATVVGLLVLTGAVTWGAMLKPKAAQSDACPVPAPAARSAGACPPLVPGNGGGYPLAGAAPALRSTDSHQDHAAMGMVLQPVPSGPPTAAQQQAAARLVAATELGTAKYRSLARAIADGYVPSTPPQSAVVHYMNWAYMKDGRILDPQRPESLVYANTVHGPLLLGAMYVMPKPGMPGPDVGGPLTQWHVHDNICFGTGGVVAGLVSPFGTCPAGTIHVETAAMLHVWTVPTPDGPFSADLDPAWVARVVRGQ